ncbi:hypothetical protein [Priestia megaterium]|nr:hypothetical protein [Priestia megaterium]
MKFKVKKKQKRLPRRCNYVGKNKDKILHHDVVVKEKKKAAAEIAVSE